VSASPFSIGTKVLGGGALLLALVIIAGFLLPTDWEAEAELVADVPPEAVFRYLDSPEGWRDWTTWPDSGVERSGPPRGEGAALAWDDPELGSGSFTLTTVEPAVRVAYRVEVEGSMITEGAISLSAEPAGLRIHWSERGNLGRNPLMGFWALSMDRAQTDELAKGLERLAAVASGYAPSRSAPDSSSSSPSR
jgi:hypothetical protein